MKQIFLFISILTTLLLLTSYSKKNKDYVTIIDYVDKTKRSDGGYSVSNDSLFIFFEEKFKHDTIELTVGRERRRLFLTTDFALGLANSQIFGNIQNISEFKLSINGRKEHKIKINNKLMNKWSVNFYRDTLKITVLKYVPFYD